jgi:hypothetical protein
VQDVPKRLIHRGQVATDAVRGVADTFGRDFLRLNDPIDVPAIDTNLAKESQL